MAKVTIANLNTLLDTVVTSNIAVQTAQSAVTNATVQAGNATTSAQAAALSKSQIDQQVIVAERLADDVNANMLATDAIKDVILALEVAIGLKADQVTLDKATVAAMLDEVLTAKSGVDVKAGLIEELVEDFHTKYLGALLVAPTVSWGGMELATGMLYYDIAKNSLMIYVNANIWVPIIDTVNMLIATNNLADLPDKAVARTNLDVMSTSEVEAQIQVDIAAIKGQPLGLAELDAAGLVPATQLPSYVDDVIEVATYADLPVIGESGKIYIVVADETSNGDTSSYRWTGTVYAMVSNSLTAADVKSLYESNLDTNAYTDAEQVKVGYITVTQAVDLDTIESDTILNNSHRTSNGTDHTYIDQDVTTTATPTFAGIITDGLVDGRDVSVDGLKLDGIEVGATADQTATEIEALYEGIADTNKYTDAEKLSVSVNTTLNTTATTLPTAINEVHGEVDAVVAGTTAITYDGAISGLTATTVKTAIDEVDADLDAHKLNDGSDHSFIDQDVTTTGTPKFNSVQLNGGTGTQGTVAWNVDEETLDLVTDGTVLQLGQEFFINVRNSTAVTITKGTPVMFAGTLGNSGRMLVIPMDGTTATNAKSLLGVAATDILAGADGKVSSNGKITGLNTTGAAVSETWVDGDVLYISPIVAGQLTKAEPTHAQLKMPVAVVINAHTAGSCYIRVTTLNENEVNAAVVEELALKVDTAGIESVNLLRADKYLAAQNIANMIYAGEDLTKIQYNTATDIDYEVLTYEVDGLSNIAHYVSGVLAGNTVLTYAAGDLVSAVYTGV